jgi:TetR/AcrR family transcriptional repressor of nem operon
MVRGKPLSFDRDEVLAKAMELFWRKGYQNTGMSELLDHMGIQRQSFYNTFGSKENIFLEAVTLYIRNLARETAAVLDRPGNPIENVRQVLNILQDEVAGADGNGCMLGNSIAEFGLNHPQISALLKKHIGRMMEAFTRAFTQAIEQGLIPATKDPSAMAKSLVAMIQGMALLSKLGYADEMLSAVMKTAEELITA